MSSAARAQQGMLELDSVRKVFDRSSRGLDDLTVLDGVDLVAGPDESVGLIGPNGAGKSTLLKLVAGVTPPTGGTVTRWGRTTSVIELGNAVHPDLTGRENIELLASLYGITPGRLPTLLDSIVEFAELEHAIDWPARQYSTGMVARLAFATAAFSDPELLLIDEVLSVGDLPFQYRCRERVDELRREGVTVMLVSHDLDLIAGVCDRVVLLRDARIEADGPAEEVISRYLGLPSRRADPDAPFSIAFSAPRVQSGEPMEFTIALDGVAGIEIDVDLVIAEHPTLAAHGIDQSVVCASERVRVEQPEATFRIPTHHLPPGRYELHGRSGPPGAASHAAPTALVLTGERPSLYTSQLSAQVTTSAIDDGPAA